MKTRFKECRKSANLSQKEVASALKVSVQAVSYWENGSRMPSHENCVSLANLYNVSLDFLLGVEENQHQSAIQFPGALKPADIVYDRPLDAARIKAAVGDRESMIQLENRHNMHKAIHEEMQELSDEHLKQAYEYVQFLKKLEEK
jgi:transcriptional regulator with XRE-family HTH domain